MFERLDALANLLSAIGQEVDPYQSPRVARALRRVVVRDLDQHVSDALMLADEDMHNATSGRDAGGASVAPAPLVVLADSLTMLRPDERSRCLAGCARIVAKRHASASTVLGDELARDGRVLLRGWLSLNLGAARERLGRLNEAHAAYSVCGEQHEHPSSATAALFALFVSVRRQDFSCAEHFSCAERELRLVLERASGTLHEALKGLRIHYATRYERSGQDPLAIVRPRLVRLGGAAEYIESELQLDVRESERSLAIPGRCAGTDSTQAAAPVTGAGGVPLRIDISTVRRPRGPSTTMSAV